jgi:hypothetical protein
LAACAKVFAEISIISATSFQRIFCIEKEEEEEEEEEEELSFSRSRAA